MTAKDILNETLLKYGYKTVHIGVPYKVLNTQFVHKQQIEKLEELIEEYANQKALHIAEQAVEYEKKTWLGDNSGLINRTSENILSRIKQLTEQI